MYAGIFTKLKVEHVQQILSKYSNVNLWKVVL